MAITTKNRRKLTHNGGEYIWWVAEDEADYGMILHVVTHDKSFVAQYLLGQKEGETKLGTKVGGPHKWFRCPCFDQQGFVTPSNVTQLIDWCFAAHKNAVPYP